MKGLDRFLEIEKCLLDTRSLLDFWMACRKNVLLVSLRCGHLDEVL